MAEWSDKMIETLRRKWLQTDPELSTSQIAADMNVSKNALMGKAHRLGLPGRPSPIRPRGPDYVAPAARPRRAPAGSLLAVELVEGAAPPPRASQAFAHHANGTPLAVARAAEKAVVVERPEAAKAAPRTGGQKCQFPAGEPGTPEFSFCGAPAVAGKPYCGAHCAVAYLDERWARYAQRKCEQGLVA